MEFSYFFEDKGEIAPEVLLPNQIWVDIGNANRSGVFDNHRQGGEKSSLESIYENPAGLEAARDYITDCQGMGKEAEIEFHLHKFPDLDCIACVYVIQRIFQEGKATPADVLGEDIACQLREYVNEIDCGRKKYLSTLNAYAFICMLGDREQTMAERSREILSNGLRLMELIEEGLREGGHIDLFTAPIKEYINVARLDQEVLEKAEQKLDAARQLYEEDKANKRVSFRKVRLWNRQTGREDDVTAAIWEKMPAGEDGYIFARESDKCLLTVYPYSIRTEKESSKTTAVTIALNPDMEEAQAYTLLPLAEILEQCEQIEEDFHYDLMGRYRRDHSRPREDEGRFAREPFSETSDPWFISEKEDMVDVPRKGSLVYYDQILSIIENASFMIRDAEIIKYQYRQDSSDRSIEKVWDKPHRRISFGRLYSETRKVLGDISGKDNDGYMLALVRIHPDKLRYNNRLLKDVCLNMVGRSNSGMNEENVFFLDYRTCLYADQSITDMK